MPQADQQEVKEFFLRVAKRLRAGWTQNTNARNAEGNSVHANAPSAVAWCLGGAGCLESYRKTPTTFIWDEMVMEKIRAREGQRHIIPFWNDDPERTKDEVIDLVLGIAYSEDEVAEEFSAAAEPEAA